MSPFLLSSNEFQFKQDVVLHGVDGLGEGDGQAEVGVENFRGGQAGDFVLRNGRDLRVERDLARGVGDAQDTRYLDGVGLADFGR